MDTREGAVRIIPIVVVMMVFMTYFLYSGENKMEREDSSQSTLSNFLRTDKKSDETCATCPDGISNMRCFDSSTPVLGGVDFVQYFTSFRVDKGTEHSYNESMVGLVGDISFSSTYNDHNFYFLSAENKRIFEKDPAKFMPQYGGFCSWGISAEFCPSYPWSKDCLGPAGNWAQWTIQNEKLYFFYVDKAKYQFLMDPTTYIAAGDSRWKDFYGEKAPSTFNTACYVKE